MGREGRGAHRKGGSREKHPAVVMMGLVGAGNGLGEPWGGWGGNGLGPSHVTPSTHLAEVRGGGQAGREHCMPKPIKCLRGHGPATWLPPVRRSEESVLIRRFLITSDPALNPPKTSPKSLQVAAWERCPPAGVTGQPGTGDSPGPSGAAGRDTRGRQRCVVMEEAPCAPLSCSSARWS